MHKKLASFIVVLSVFSGWAQAQVIPTAVTAIESYDMSGYFLVCRATGQSVRLTQAGDQTTQGQWMMVPGLNSTAGTVSFKSVALDNHYMRHSGFILYAVVFASDATYASDASWTPRPGLANPSDPTLVSFESTNFPGRYIQRGTSTTTTWPVTTLTTTSAATDLARATFRFRVYRTDNASRPVPADRATDVIRQPTLMWKPGVYAAKHDVYMGTSLNDVNNATRTNSLGVLVKQDQDANSYIPSPRLEFNTTYYWRIDEVNAPPTSTIIKGDVWSFTTEPYSYKLTGLKVTASSWKSADEDPNGTIDGTGLTGDLHSTEEKTMWVTPKASAGGKLPQWIQYDFDKVYKLDQMWVWNYNSASELDVGLGAKDTTIEYSVDGITWAVLGNYEFADSVGEESYAHNTEVPLKGIAAKSVRLTITSSWISTTQTGLSEVRFFYLPIWAREPKPANNATNINPGTSLSWRSGREAASHQVYVGVDPNAMTLTGSSAVAGYSPVGLSLGMKYYWRIDEVNSSETPTSWAGDVWNFTTPDFLMVDDMESYTDQQGQAVFNIWKDGYGTTTNGGLIGYDPPAACMEKTTVHAGTQSAPFRYGETSAAVSEATLAFAGGRDWTLYGIKTVAFWFYGAPDNGSAPLYVKINGKQIAYTGEAGNLQRSRWNQANFDLAGVPNLNNVTSLTIGLANNGAKGMLFIDDIRLYKAAPALPVASDPGTTGLVAYFTMNDNVQDSSGKGNNGVIMGTPTFAAGKSGTALSLNGTTDCVDLGKKDVWNPTGSFSVSLWANIGAWGSAWAHVMMSNRGETDNSVGNGWQIRRGAGTGLCWTTRGIGGTDDLTGATPPQNQWVHITCVFDQAAATKTLYINGLMSATGNVNANATIKATTTNAYIGARATADNSSRDSFFTGLLDEIRVYNRALTAGEADFLSKP